MSDVLNSNDLKGTSLVLTSGSLYESMNEISTPPNSERGPVVAAPDTPNIHPYVPAPPPLNGVRQGIKDRLDELHVKQREIFLQQLELTSRWNRSLMITQLPVEILTLIFVYSSMRRRHPFSDEDNGDYFRVTLAKSQWTKLMLVCRRWCDVVRTTPALWRTIDVGMEKAWLKLSLIRSDNALIDISFSSDFDEEHMALLEPHYHRLRSFRLGVWSPTALRVIRENLSLVLESLEVLDTPFEEKYTTTDLGLTAQRFPNLRTLQVARTPLPIDPLFYTRIRKLSLKECPYSSSLEQFIQLLSDMPSLRYLDLDDFLQNLSDGGDVGPPRSLPSLRFLGLHNHVPTFSTEFLARIVIPPTASLSISVDTDYAESYEHDNLRVALPPNLRPSLPQLKNVTWGRLTTIYGEYTIECHSTVPEPGETILVKLALTSSMGRQWDYQLSDGVTDLVALFGSAPLTHLESRGYCVSSAYDVESWAKLFRAFPSLVSLEVYADDTVLAGLLDASLATPTNLNQPVSCLGLERIVLNDEWGALTGDRVDAVFYPLVRCLVYRAERGVRLKELRLEFHRVVREALREKYLPQLESLVPDVVFGDAWAKNDRD